jgi:hypothetical protein
MGYVQAGYSIVLGLLFLYGIQLLWRRRRLNRAVARVGAAGATAPVRNADGPGVGRPSGGR